MSTSLGKSLLEGLKAYGAREIFGIPGDFALPLFKVIEDSNILPLYTLSHEPAVGFAADAAARLRGGISVAAVTYGAGGFNLLNAVASAYAEKSPVVVLSGGPGLAEANAGLLIHHQAKHLKSQRDIFREVTCDQAILDDPQKAPTQVARVLARCITESRPVYIEVPRDQVFVPAGDVPAPEFSFDVEPEALEACVTEIAAKIAAAESPVLVVGVEVRRFGLEAEVATLASRLDIPVVTTFMGRGLLAGAGVPFFGTYLGVAGDQDVTQMVEESDALLLLGVITSDSNFGISRQRINLKNSILACDATVTMGYHVYPQIPLKELVPALSRQVKVRESSLVSTAPVSPRGLVVDDGRIEPLDIAAAINDLFDIQGQMPIAADMGDCLFTAMDFENTRLVAPGYYASMGFGVPAGLGVQAATGERPLIVVGDGAFQMTGWELLNCRRYGWDPVVLVFNNRSWEMLRVFQPEASFNDLPELDFAEIAVTLGGRGYHACTRRDLRDALTSASQTRGQFQLIDIKLQPGSVSPTLDRFVKGIVRMRANGK